MTNTSNTKPSLEEVLQHFMMMADEPNSPLLAQLSQAYPEYAAQLADFAAEWQLQDRLEAMGEADQAPENLHDYAMSRFEKARAQHKQPQSNPFDMHSPNQLKHIARGLGIDTAIMAKLRNRMIHEETVPRQLKKELASQLGILMPVLVDYLRQPTQLTANANYKANEKPEATEKEDFLDAIRKSTLTGEEKSQWMD